MHSSSSSLSSRSRSGALSQRDKELRENDSESWGAQRGDDLVHWGRFPAFHALRDQGLLREPRLTIPASASVGEPGPGAVFMRWKERFLVPDHRVKSISGASFEGFYYICFDQREGGVSGIYFHAKSEKYQQLELKHVAAGGCVGAVEFR